MLAYDVLQQLAPELFKPHNIRRVKRRLAHQLYARFQHVSIFLDEHHTLHTRSPTALEGRLVHRSLALFTPWDSPHVPPPAPTLSILETYFAGASARPD